METRKAIYEQCDVEEKPKKAGSLESTLDDTMSDLALSEGTADSSPAKRLLRDQSTGSYDDDQFYLRQDLGGAEDAMLAFRNTFLPGDEDMGWYAVVTIRVDGDSQFTRTTGSKILVICWIQIIEDSDGAIIGWTWEGPEVHVPLDFLRGYGRMVV